LKETTLVCGLVRINEEKGELRALALPCMSRIVHHPQHRLPSRQTAMTTACDTFFSLPELVVHLPPFLPTRDLAHLLRTNRSIYSICSPTIWRSVDIGSVLLNLINKPNVLKAFSDNIDSVQSLTCDPDVSWYYINALWLYLNSAIASEAHKTIPTDALSHPNWGKLYPPVVSFQNDYYTQLTPLPPFLRLARFTYQVGRYLFSEPSVQLEHSSYDRDPHQHQILWLLRLNRKTLTYLRLDAAPFWSGCLTRDVCRTVSQLDNLRTLQLGFPFTVHDFTPQVLKILFFSCPESLVEFKVWGDVARNQEALNLDPEVSDWDFSQGPLVFRQQRLYFLTTLELPTKLYPDYPGALLCSILQHCPVLKKLALPWIRDKYENPDVLRTIRTCCPGITDLSLCESSDKLLVDILEQAPEQQLESIRMNKVYNDLPMIAAISRHSETLRVIDFPDCGFLESATLQVILMSCRALQVLRIQNDDFSYGSAIPLKDAVANKWASAGIRVLDITVNITQDGRDPAFLADRTMATWTEQDRNCWRMLDKFYTQIGSLKELEVLILKSAGNYPPVRGVFGPTIPFRATSLPGLLALEDVTTGQIGFLSRWSGLTRLRDLHGSFLWTNAEAKARMGEREVEWFATHLPALRRAAFLNVPFKETLSDDIPVILQDLHIRRPELRLDYNLDDDQISDDAFG
jgi:hypothetical protein